MEATAGRAGPKRPYIAALIAVVVPALLVCACGGSKPAFCQKSTELKSAVSSLTHINLAKEGLSGAEAAVRRVQSSAKGLVEAAKSEFPKQTEAISSSADAFAESVKAASNPTTSSTAVAQIPGELVALGTAVSDFASATESKCK
jgi:hypothetical protein